MTTYSSPWTSTSALSSGSNSTRSPTSTARACGPTATTFDQASRRAPIAAVAGITMPPAERRSPDSRSSSTSSRSRSILIGVLSVTLARVLPVLGGGCGSAGGPADHREQHDHAHHAADGPEDVVGARLARDRVDVVRPDAVDLAADDRLRAGPVDQLVDGAGQALPGLLDLALEGGGVVGAHVVTPGSGRCRTSG